MLISKSSDYKKIKLDTIANRPAATGVLMCTPEYFNVIDVKNYFMEDAVGSVDREKAKKQWETLRDLYSTLGLRVEVIQGEPDIEDMVFSANAGLTWVTNNGEKIFLASNMKHESRQRETPYYRTWFAEHGYHPVQLEAKIFEGGGDAIWYPGKLLLFGGYGHRTVFEAYEEITRRWDIPVVLLELASKEFYHLDTALCVIDERTAIYCPDAFNDQGNALIEGIFARRIPIMMAQGKNYFTGNAFSVYGHDIVMQQGDVVTVKKMKELGYRTHEVDLGEFIKSGGNATCLKLDIY